MRQQDDVVPDDHSLRPVRVVINAALVKIDSLSSQMYDDDIKDCRHSLASEKLLRVLLLQVFYSIGLERQLMKQTQSTRCFADWLVWP